MGQFGSEQARRVIQGSGMSGAPRMGGIEQLAETVATDMEQRLPGQRKTQRGKLALLVATMLEVRSANLMDVAACLPRPAERLDSRYQWIKRFLANARVVSDAVMAPYGREVLARLSAQGQTVVLLIDQTKVSERYQVVMVAVRLGGRALPLAWRNVAMVHEAGHPEPWIIALSQAPSVHTAFDYGLRWGIEAMFSDFKTRGFGLEDSQITRTDRLDRLVLVLSLALHWAVSTGMWDAVENRTPAEKRPRERSAGMLPAA